ncbi:Rrf2 family transcriptional regulator [Sorangium cellulosum]|uniref:Rrf2 family transcriptional regulator n=1 Tax=Sorangium cellulosum TaxID=56 RepID=A0A2L0EQY5_SORCE|nr:Rrf2 family transcriptional regulator [Sorangium cellulosum]AUX41713.1 Rrf2 family transcriptional regulator [Sorangium cellulosum]
MTSRFAMAIHVLGKLAFVHRERQETLTSEDLAKSVQAHPVVVRRLLGSLRRAGLVETKRGVGGGISLARSPERITLRDVYDAVEQDEEIIARNPKGANPCSCDIAPLINEYLDEVFGAAEQALKDSLVRVTIADLEREICDRLERCAKRTAS